MEHTEARPVASAEGHHPEPSLLAEETIIESCPTCISGVDAVVQQSKVFEQALDEDL